jgi:hypothetical protein
MRQRMRAADVVAVFVRDEDRVDLLGQHAGLAQAPIELADTQAAIHQQMARVGVAARLDDRGVAAAAAAETLEAQHRAMKNDALRA